MPRVKPLVAITVLLQVGANDAEKVTIGHVKFTMLPTHP